MEISMVYGQFKLDYMRRASDPIGLPVIDAYNFEMTDSFLSIC